MQIHNVSIKQTNIILSAVLLIGIGLLYPAYQLRSQAAAETIHLQAELIGTQQEMDKRLLATNEAKQVEKNINLVGLVQMRKISLVYEYTRHKNRQNLLRT